MTQKDKNDRVREVVAKMSLRYAPFEIARWFSLGDESTRNLRSLRVALNRKTLSEGDKDLRGSTTADVVCWQLIDFLEREGYDLGTIQWDVEGRLIGIRKGPTFEAE